ncbi:MAG: pyrroline-5-carboxylate reductase [Gammaproteobacteria bacterium]
MQVTYAFIGAGNMGRALIGGLIAAGHPTDAIRVVETDPAARAACRDAFALEASSDLSAAGRDADVIVLAVKPQNMRQAADALAAEVRTDPLYLTVAAGITSGQLASWIGRAVPIVRAMPNTPALIGAGIAALYANGQVSAKQREQAARLLDAVGHALWLDDESQMDAVTALSGSGPAYFFLFIEHLEAAGEALGLPAALARRLALETAYGASRLARESTQAPAALRAQVTSPGGTTEAALACFAEAGFGEMVVAALTKARDRAVALSRQMDT